jgi:2-deoxy-D-gluconate 3-dehydrogenase
MVPYPNEDPFIPIAAEDRRRSVRTFLRVSASDWFDLSDRVAVVTGARRGIGRGLALGLAQAGADVVAVARTAPEELAAEIERLGRRCVPIAADFAYPAQVDRVIPEAARALGRVDILVNNAGTGARGPAVDVTPHDWHRVLQVNLHAVFALSQQAARDMLPRGRGKIINIASLMSFQGGILIAAYTASKGAVAQLTKLLANEWAPAGINVNAIAPGYIETDLTRPLRDDAVRNPAILARIPAGRWGRPDDLAGAVVFLASRASDYVHGHVLAVDGGWLAR